MTFPKIISDSRIPEDQLWFYSHEPIEIIAPCGHMELRNPDFKIINIGQEDKKSTLDWITAPH